MAQAPPALAWARLAGQLRSAIQAPPKSGWLMLFLPRPSLSRLEIGSWLSRLAVPRLRSSDEPRAELLCPLPLLLHSVPELAVVAMRQVRRSPARGSPAGVSLPESRTDPLPTSCASILPCRRRGQRLNSTRRGCSRPSCENRRGRTLTHYRDKRGACSFPIRSSQSGLANNLPEAAVSEQTIASCCASRASAYPYFRARKYVLTPGSS